MILLIIIKTHLEMT